jgi:hypothetical protein
MPPNSRPALPAIRGPVLNDIRNRIAFLAASAEACDGSLPFIPNGCVPRDGADGSKSNHLLEQFGSYRVRATK